MMQFIIPLQCAVINNVMNKILQLLLISAQKIMNLWNHHETIVCNYKLHSFIHSSLYINCPKNKKKHVAIKELQVIVEIPTQTTTVKKGNCGNSLKTGN